MATTKTRQFFPTCRTVGYYVVVSHARKKRTFIKRQEPIFFLPTYNLLNFFEIYPVFSAGAVCKTLYVVFTNILEPQYIVVYVKTVSYALSLNSPFLLSILICTVLRRSPVCPTFLRKGAHVGQ